MVRIVVLLENRTESPKLKCKHGLSLYIETNTHKILFDTGPNDLFLKNAEVLGVDISAVDIAVISHGHADHCGGLGCFLKANKRAKIYIRQEAFEKHYVKAFGIPFYAGIDRTLAENAANDRFVFTDELCEIAKDKLTLFSDVSGCFPLPKSDGNLFVKRDGKMVGDVFGHEQNLIVTSGDKSILICGCAHAGIVNIIDKAKTLTGNFPSDVVGGFHLYEPVKRRYENGGYISSVAEVLARFESSYYTCHCTGVKAYEKMKPRLENRLTYIHTGSEIFF